MGIARHMYFLSRGTVGVYVVDEQNEDQLVSTRSSGFFFGEVAFFGNRRREASVKTRSFCEIDALGYGDIEHIMASNQDLAAAIHTSAKAVFSTLHMMKRGLDNESIKKKRKAEILSKKASWHMLKHISHAALNRVGHSPKSQGSTEGMGGGKHEQLTRVSSKHRLVKGMSSKQSKRLNKKYDLQQAVAFGQLVTMARSGSSRMIDGQAPSDGVFAKAVNDKIPTAKMKSLATRRTRGAGADQGNPEQLTVET